MKIRIFFTIVSLIILSSINLFPQEVTSATFEQKDDKIYIYYELKANTGIEYEIEDVVLKKISLPDFELKPDNLSGDIGKGKFGSGIRTIVWIVNKKEQNILSIFGEADDFIFKFRVSPPGKGIPWYYYAGGAVIAGGGTALYFLLKKDETTTQPSEVNFASPPVRP